MTVSRVRPGRAAGRLPHRTQRRASGVGAASPTTPRSRAAAVAPLRLRAELKDAGDGGPAVTWASEPTAEESKAGVTDLTRSDALVRASEGPGPRWTRRATRPAGPARPAWSSCSRRGPAPAWTRSAWSARPRRDSALGGASRRSRRPRSSRTGGRRAGPAHGPPDRRPARGEARLRGGARAAPGAEVPAEASEGRLAVKGVLVGEEQEIPATATWTTTEEGLRLALKAPGRRGGRPRRGAPRRPRRRLGRRARGLPAPAHLRPGPGSGWRRWTRVLIGDPAAAAGATSTLLALVRPEGAPPADLRGPPVARPGPRGAPPPGGGGRGVGGPGHATSRARSARPRTAWPPRARSPPSRPARPSCALRTVAQAYPFNPADPRRGDPAGGRARDPGPGADRTALEDALRDYGVYRSSESLVPMEQLAERLGAQFLGEGHPEGDGGRDGASWTSCRAAAARREPSTSSRRTPGVERLERLVALLGRRGGLPAAGRALRAGHAPALPGTGARGPGPGAAAGRGPAAAREALARSAG